jgi:NAD(P)-dependent dehydrogenase (short-subunit alcohol dehydrogenase family)
MGRRGPGQRAGAPRRHGPVGQQAGRRAVGISVDVADHTAVDAAADQVEDALGPIDLWVNDAFTGAHACFDDIEPQEYEGITAVTRDSDDVSAAGRGHRRARHRVSKSGQVRGAQRTG